MVEEVLPKASASALVVTSSPVPLSSVGEVFGVLTLGYNILDKNDVILGGS